jgi:hypothetical protein
MARGVLFERALAQHGAVRIELVDQRDPGCQLQARDLVRVELVELHHDRPVGVAVRDNQDVLALADVAEDGTLVERQGAGGGVLEGLAVGGRGRERPAPDVDLLVAVPCGGFGLVESLEVAVVALVERLVPDHRDV